MTYVAARLLQVIQLPFRGASFTAVTPGRLHKSKLLCAVVGSQNFVKTPPIRENEEKRLERLLCAQVSLRNA
jgi:hypothetical protein